MMQFLSSVVAHLRHLKERLGAIEEYADERERWRGDLLSHPDIARMTQRELADLPFASVRER